MQVYTAIDGKISGIYAENMGSRGIGVGASGYPSGHIIVSGNHVRNCGLVPAGGGSPSLETYSLSSHNTITGNEVWQGNSSGIQVHGLRAMISNNQVWATGVPGYACYSFDTAEHLVISNNIASGCGGNGFLLYGSAVANTTEASRAILTGNIAQDTVSSGFMLGTAGSPNYVTAAVTGNFAYRARGADGGFAIFTATPANEIVLTGNRSEGNTTYGYRFGNTAEGHTLTGNFSARNTTAGYSLNSPAGAVLTANYSESDTVGFALGASLGVVLIANSPSNAGTSWTGTASVYSTILANPGFQNSIRTDQALTPGNTAFASLPAPLNGMVVYCNDCTIANPCAGAGTGAIAKRLNGVWVCN